MTFGPHPLSDQSTLLIPKSIESEALSHLKNFRGRIISFDDDKPLRSVIIDQLESHYPNT